MPAPRVQYYFGTKAELITAALMELGRRVVGRGMTLMAEAGPDARPELLVRAALAGSQPTDEEMRHNLVLFFAFYTSALSDPLIGESGLVDAQRFIVDTFAGYIRTAQERGETREGVDPEHEARLILFSNSGLVLAALIGIHGNDDAVATMDYLLGKLFLPIPDDAPRRASRRGPRRRKP